MKTIIANFKSNKNRKEYEEWLTEFEKSTSSLPTTVSVVLAPSLVDLFLFSNRLGSTTSSIHLGIQDLSPFPSGAYTGAIGSVNLEGFSVTHAILGHSERRRYFHETAQDIANKVKECLAVSITPIVCVTKDQINETANALSSEERKQVMVAFEPIEHIGTGTSDTIENIIQTKAWVETAFGSVPYIYGGSVNLSTDPTILSNPQIDGFLVGSACLDATQFVKLLSSIV